MSSRNEYLNNEERIIAAIIQQALQEGKNLIISRIILEFRSPDIMRFFPSCSACWIMAAIMRSSLFKYSFLELIAKPFFSRIIEHEITSMG
jgi:hypothetical protein